MTEIGLARIIVWTKDDSNSIVRRLNDLMMKEYRRILKYE